MSDEVWPPTIKPLLNKSYTTSRGSNIVNIDVAGGVPRIGLNLSIEAVPFQLNFTLSDNGYKALSYFYDWRINHGADSFKMQLDSGNGIEEHQCIIVPGTWKMTRPSNGNWYLAVTLIAESTSSQLEEDCPNFYDLYNCYGDQLPSILSNLDSVIVNMENKLEYQ
jgi:hypothetical protein